MSTERVEREDDPDAEISDLEPGEVAAAQLAVMAELDDLESWEEHAG